MARNQEKGERVVAELAAGASRCQGRKLSADDLSKIADMRACAAAFKAKYGRARCAGNNAGGIYQKKQLSADGLEMTLRAEPCRLP